MKKLFSYLFLGILVIVSCVFVRCESGNVIKAKKGDHVVDEPQYVLHWGFGFYIKDYDYDYFDYKTTHFGTSPVIADQYTVNLKESGYRIKIKIETCYWNRSDIDAVALFRLDHNGMKEKFYRPLIEELLRSRIPATKDDLFDIKNQLEIGLHNFWKDQLPWLKFEVIEIEATQI